MSTAHEVLPAPPEVRLGMEFVTLTWMTAAVGMQAETLRRRIRRGRFPAGTWVDGVGMCYPRPWALRWIEAERYRREMESLRWPTDDAPEWLIYHLAGDEWGVMHRDETVHVAASEKEARAYLAQVREGKVAC